MNTIRVGNGALVLRRRASAVATAAVLVASGLLVTAPTAEAAGNQSPATATVVTAVPFVAYAEESSAVAPDTDRALRLAADRCSAGAAAWVPSWAVWTAPTASTVVAQAKPEIFSEGLAQVAVLDAELSQVPSCGPTTPVAVAAGQKLYVVGYSTRVAEGSTVATHIALLPTSGVAPANDRLVDRATIGSVPFSTRFDTTLAQGGADNTCGSYFDEPTHDVWWQYTPTVSGRYRFEVTEATAYFSPTVMLYSDNGARCQPEGGQLDMIAGSTYWVQVVSNDGTHHDHFPTGGQATLVGRRVDATPPTWSKLPTASMIVGSQLSTVRSPCVSGAWNSAVPVVVDYRAVDSQSGVSRYTVSEGQMTTDLGLTTRYTTTAHENDRACGGADRSLVFGAVNGDGERSAAITWPANRLAVIEDTALRWTGTWTSTSCSTCSAGTSRRRTVKGAAASLWDPLESTCRHASLSIL